MGIFGAVGLPLAHSDIPSKRSTDRCIVNFPPRSLGGTSGFSRESPPGLSNV